MPHNRFNKGNRDDNEQEILLMLFARNVRYTQMREGDGFDLLIWINPPEFWEVKNPKARPSDRVLTEAEYAAYGYCAKEGISYHIIDSFEDAVERLNLHFGGK